MSDLRNILKEEYKKKEEVVVTPLSLMEMIEQLMNLQETFGLVVEQEAPAHAAQQAGEEITLRWRPYLPTSEIDWGTPSAGQDGEGDGEDGVSETTARAQLKMYLKNITEGGTNLQDKINALNDFLKNINVGDKSALNDMGRSLSFMMFYRTLYGVISDFNAAAAGFIYESFFSVLLDAERGHQVPASGAETIADFIVYTGGKIPISLKVYSKKGLKVGGSYKQIVSDLTGEFNMMQYVVVTKEQEGGKAEGTPKTTTGLDFAAFNIKLDSLAQILELTKHGIDQVVLPTAVVEAYGNAKNINAVINVLSGDIAGKGFETRTVTHSKFGSKAELEPAQQQRYNIALDIPPATRLSIAPGVNALKTALQNAKPPLPPDVADAIATTAMEWFNDNYEMDTDTSDLLKIGHRKDGDEKDYLLSSSGKPGVFGWRAGQKLALWGALYNALGAFPEIHSNHPKAPGKGRDRNFLRTYIDNALPAAEAAQKAYKDKQSKGEGGGDPRTARVKAIYGERTREQKQISFQILKELGSMSDLQPAKKAWHLTAGYQGAGGNSQFELTGKGNFKTLYSNGIVELPYGPVDEAGTFASISLKEEDIQKTVNTVLSAFNENMTKALNGMQDLIDDMNLYVLGGLKTATKAEDAKKDAEKVENAMAEQYREHRKQAAE